MTPYDYMPHRLLLNRSLRKASEELRAKVDEWQAEYERRLAECAAEIERLESRLSAEREAVQARIDEELAEYEESLSAFNSDVEAYADCYLHLEGLRKARSVKWAQIAICKEEEGFLSEQMRIIGEEVEMLETRANELASLADISDLVELASLTSSPLDLSASISCRGLLEKAEARIARLPGEYSPERFALERLKVVVHERAEHLDTIQYIMWVIKQKIAYSKQLSTARADIRGELNTARSALSELNLEISETNLVLDKLAWVVRTHWTRPIVYLSADIAYAKRRKEEIRKRQNDIRSNHEYDPDWDSLKREYGRLKAQISDKAKARDVWHGRRRLVCEICKRNNVQLRLDGHRGRHDELQLVRARLDELEAIREAGMAEADARCDAERQEIEAEWDESQRALCEELASAERHVQELESLEERLREGYIAATERMRAARAADTRFLLLRAFSDTREVSLAKSARSHAAYQLNLTCDELRDAKASRDAKAKELKDSSSTYERKLAACKPRPLRPTAEELLEEEKLKLLLQELEGSTKRGADL